MARDHKSFHFTTDYIHYRLSKRNCNQEEMQYFVEGQNTRCVCWLDNLLLIVDSVTRVPPNDQRNCGFVQNHLTL